MKNIILEVKKIFSKSLKIPIKEINNKLSYISSEKWDSINHMNIIAGIEKKYKIQLKMKDIIAMETFSKSITIIKKYLKNNK